MWVISDLENPRWYQRYESNKPIGAGIYLEPFLRIRVKLQKSYQVKKNDYFLFLIDSQSESAKCQTTKC